ncbi:zonular occludens toxin domain-containing protein [Aeromonas hydrophila]|uniref:zonular occludens toxin domain-containing protein n=1 Tax=Aeromonas hydrophila TaxID=644 RepID=UPI002B46E750|nr:zonular occludens toxin domain-containing protein [Aeromonas hydrophila]
MAINIIVGRPGSGKSFEAVAYHLIPAIESGRRVVTNLPLHLDHFVAVYGSDVLDLIEVVADDFSKDLGVIKAFSTPSYFTSDEWRDDKGRGPLFIIDECHFQYPKTGRGKKASDDIADCLEYFSMHRHYGHDILLMTQSLGKLNRDLRDMIEVQYSVSKHTALGSQKSYTRKTLDGAGVRPAVTFTGVRTYDAKYYPFYKSHTQSEGDVKEAMAGDVSPIWKRWWLWLSVPLVVAGLWFSVSSMGGILGGGERSSGAKAASSSSVQPMPTTPAAVPPMPVPKREKPQGPFDHFDISITGFADLTYKDNTGQLHPQIEYYLQARSKNSYTFDMKLSDLLMAGYQVDALGPCLIRLEYKEQERFLYCLGHQPRQESATAAVALPALPLS